MWIASKLGFFSIVIDNSCRRGTTQKWLVRARREKDLENLLMAVPQLKGEKVLRSPTADYCARLRVDKGQLYAVTHVLTQTIDYPNFKSSIHDNPDQADKSDSYMKCWHAMFDYQNRRRYNDGGYPRELPRSAEFSFDELDAMAETETRSDLRIV